MHQLDQSPSVHPRVYLTLDKRIEPKVRKFKTIKVIRIAVTHLNHLFLYASQVAL